MRKERVSFVDLGLAVIVSSPWRGQEHLVANGSARRTATILSQTHAHNLSNVMTRLIPSYEFQ
jgi:hypothetical protein